MNAKANYYIEKLQLTSHPEGGYFRETYRSDELLHQTNLPSRYSSSRAFSTSIYFLLEGSQISKFHRLKSDEQWHFYDGSTIILYTINKFRTLNKLLIGREMENKESFQVNILKDTWFAAEVMDKTPFALVGCTVAPGFDFDDFELGNRENLLSEFPKHKDIIIRLTDQ
ncbi:MAG: cupin domain-containing protein [Ignavibacteria bacterium]